MFIASLNWKQIICMHKISTEPLWASLKHLSTETRNLEIFFLFSQHFFCLFVYAFAYLLMLLETTFFHLSSCVVLVQYYDHLIYAFLVRRKPQKALHSWLNELYLRLELCRGSLILFYYFLLSLHAITPRAHQRTKNRKLSKSRQRPDKQVLWSGAEESSNQTCNKTVFLRI